MINVAEIKSSYNSLYKEMRRYIWDYHVVEILADLEIACYQTCPNVANIKFKLNLLHTAVRHVCKQDEDLERAFEKFKEKLQNEDSAYSKLLVMKEVFDYADYKENEQQINRRVDEIEDELL